MTGQKAPHRRDKGASKNSAPGRSFAHRKEFFDSLLRKCLVRVASRFRVAPVAEHQVSPRPSHAQHFGGNLSRKSVINAVDQHSGFVDHIERFGGEFHLRGVAMMNTYPRTLFFGAANAIFLKVDPEEISGAKPQPQKQQQSHTISAPYVEDTRGLRVGADALQGPHQRCVLGEILEKHLGVVE